MKLYQLLSADRIKLNLTATTREDVIDQLATVLTGSTDLPHHEMVKEMVLKREEQVGTGIGYGVAIPHADPGPFPQPLVAFGRLTAGVDFHAPDGGKAQLIFLLLTPEKTPALHVRLLARICRLLKSDNLRLNLLSAEQPEQAVTAIKEAEADYPELNP